MKSCGSNKIGYSCPSRMIVNFVGKTVKVEFFREHVGHICELIRTKIPSDDRAKIAGNYRRIYICTFLLRSYFMS